MSSYAAFTPSAKMLRLEIVARTQAEAEERGASAATDYFGHDAWTLVSSRADIYQYLMDGTITLYEVDLEYRA